MKISVLTPSFNSDKCIKRAIDSVLIQNYTNYEHIIVDGDSTDNTLLILKEYDNIKYLSEKDSGQSEAMNKAFKISSGDIIVYLNADDEFEPGAFNTIIKAFEENPCAHMVVGNLLYKTANESTIRVPSIRYSDVLQYWLSLFPNNPISYFYKRKVQQEIGEFPINEHYSMDIWFLLKAYRKFKLAKIDAVLGTYHSDGMNKTATANLGYNLHTVVKNHLKNDNPLMLPFFYFKLFLGKFNL